MTRRTIRRDPIENEIELALSPGEFIRDRACFSFVSGLEAVTVSQVRSSHRRKTGFMPAFEAVATGAGDKEQPSFLDRAKARWSGKRTGDPA
jgi:hypothetical protein